MEINEPIERKLKAELDFFKIYAIFVIGLVTGNVNLLKDFLQNQNKSSLVLLIIGLVILGLILVALVSSYFKIRNLIK